ncbi:MAG: thioredoxin [Tannerella sp.]|jgi:thioredoxin 1|nr:thioredoxin [Tannerella sp.]
MTLTVTDENYKELVSGEKPIVLDFWAEWCGPCKMIAPIMDELSAEYGDRVIIGKVDVDNNDGIVAAYGIRNIPTLLFLKDGNLIDKHVGADQKDLFASKINNLLLLTTAADYIREREE